MIIHISKERLDKIWAASWPLGKFPERPVAATEGDNVLHILDGDVGFCFSCDREFHAIEANTPAEYELAKGALRKKAA